jgi:tRNA(Ile2)-agmatinylcytidine synthase
VASRPRVITGGHLIFSLRDTKKIDCACYEPTKKFRNIIRELYPGDKITVYGGVRKTPLTLNIEKIKIHKLATIHHKVENPFCPQCKRHMKSMGKKGGYRCRHCGEKTNKENAKIETIKRKLLPGFYEVPVVARRHLAKPLKRMKTL